MNKYEKAFDVIDTILHLMCGEEREDGYKPSQDEMVNSMEDFKELVERATPKKYVIQKRKKALLLILEDVNVGEKFFPQMIM